MNETTYLFFALCLAALLWNLVAGIRIVQKLDKPSSAEAIFVMRYLPWRYLHDYRKLTVSQSGKIGPLYYHYTFSILAVLLTGLLLVVLLVY
jgi:hypothetical protein